MTLNCAGCRGPQTAHKVTGDYRSRWGADQGATFAALLATARKLGQNDYEQLGTIASPSPLHAAGLTP